MVYVRILACVHYTLDFDTFCNPTEGSYSGHVIDWWYFRCGLGISRKTYLPNCELSRFTRTTTKAGATIAVAPSRFEQDTKEGHLMCTSASIYGNRCKYTHIITLRRQTCTHQAMMNMYENTSSYLVPEGRGAHV